VGAFARIRRWLYQPFTLRPEIRCAACDRARTPNGPKFISGPGVYLCQPCVADALVGVASVPPGTSATHRLGGKAPSQCSFCGRKMGDARGLLGLLHAAICRDCLELSQVVFDTAPAP